MKFTLQFGTETKKDKSDKIMKINESYKHEVKLNQLTTRVKETVNNLMREEFPNSQNVPNMKKLILKQIVKVLKKDTNLQN